MKLLLGDCLDKLKELEDNSVDSIVTDPPYGLSFMAKKWDYDVPSTEVWEECVRVLKPGGHLLAFAGSRTYHRMAVRIEDAGFEIRDQIMWIYGSGFPKSHDVGKNIEKRKVGGIKNLKQIGTKQGIKVETGTQGFSYNKEYVPGISMGGKQISGDIPVYEITNEWGGWGTALKPAHEPIVMARKPLTGKSVADNVIEWGTGGINIDDSRIPTTDNLGGGATNGSVLDIEGFDRPWMHDEEKMKEFGEKMKQKVEHAETLGRFPANVIFDEEAGKLLDEQSGISKQSGKLYEGKDSKTSFGQVKSSAVNTNYGDIGGASRFFYCPKTSKAERNEGLDEFATKNGVSQFTSKGGLKCKKCDKWKNSGNPCKCDEPEYEQQQWNGTIDKNNHPTVKPTDLMLYLIRLVTPKGGTTLDPFMGSGSTGKAAIRGGFDFIGIEREEEYFQIAESRINYEINKPSKTTKSKVSKGVEEKVNQFFG